MPEDDNPDGGLRTLLDRKAEGVAVLVSGAVPAAVHRSMSARLLGSPEVDRRRMLALTGLGRAAVDERLPPNASTRPERLRAVFGDGWCRSARSPANTANDGEPTARFATPSTEAPAAADTLHAESLTVVEDTLLSVFGERLSHEMTALAGAADGLEPGQLRLCLDSIDRLAHDHENDDVLRFAHLVADQVRCRDGMMHIHSHSPPDDLPVPNLTDVADVTIRLRRTGTVPEFRPYLEGEALTDWSRMPPGPG